MKNKVIACVLAVAMLAGIFTGCSKTTKININSFEKACKKLKLEEIDADESPDEDEIEDGFYMIKDDDYLEDAPEDVTEYLEQFGLDDVIDVDDVTSVGIALKGSGLDDLDLDDPEDAADAKVDLAFAILMELDENYVDDVMEYVEDQLDTYDITTKNLSGKEYFSSKNEGYYRLHIDIAKFVKLLLDDDTFLELMESLSGDTDVEEILESLSGDVAFSIEVTKTNIFIIGGFSLNTKPSEINSFSSAFGASNPAKLPMNTKFAEEVI
ncbi:MAG: hypothetical protein IKR78_04360, partial [Dehalococcoidales bacterium]|nr:hypothetical protein [Erysipelotrichaceae bacterium]MBR6332346.1 hypothetical protein [Dehalococcoidales bacterium]